MLDGRTIGKYRILEQIGRGGMGTVYKAVDETLDRLVAIKMINADNLSAERMQRFRSEAVTLAKLSHPRIATIHELTRDDRDLLMVMEYVPGETLERIVTQNGALPLPQAVTLCEQVLEALAHAHGAGIVHRDLKPSNLMVTPSGDVKVMDFGIARIAGSEHLTTDGYMMGTPAYMSPEQVRGAEVDARMDLYAIAVVLYRLLTNSLPFRAETPVQLIQSQLMDQPTAPRQIRPDLPQWVDDVLLHGLAKTPDQRFQTAAEFRLALQRGLSGGAVPLTPSLFDQTGAETYAVVTPIGLRTTPSQSMPIPGTASGALRMPSGQMPLAYTPGAMSSGAMQPGAMPPNMTPSGAMPVGQPTGATRTDATVTLRTPHLALMAGLLALLVVVVGLLAYAALRRPSATVAVVAPGASTPASTPAVPAAPDPASATPPAATPAPVTDLAAPAAGTPAAAAPNTAAPRSTTATPPVVSAPAPSAAAPTAATPGSRSAAAASTPTAPPTAAKTRGSPSTPATPPAKDGAAAAAKAAPAPAPASTPASPGSADAAGRRTDPAPAATEASTVESESFGDLKALLPQSGDTTKGREQDVLLGLEPGRLVLRSRGSGAVLKTLPYKSIAAATYIRDKRPKGSDDSSMAAVPENFGGSSFFLGSAKHWLTLQSISDFLILRLEDKNMRSITLAIESRTGIKTQRVELKPQRGEPTK